MPLRSGRREETLPYSVVVDVRRPSLRFGEAQPPPGESPYVDHYENPCLQPPQKKIKKIQNRIDSRTTVPQKDSRFGSFSVNNNSNHQIY